MANTSHVRRTGLPRQCSNIKSVIAVNELPIAVPNVSKQFEYRTRTDLLSAREDIIDGQIQALNHLERPELPVFTMKYPAVYREVRPARRVSPLGTVRGD